MIDQIFRKEFVYDDRMIKITKQCACLSSYCYIEICMLIEILGIAIREKGDYMMEIVDIFLRNKALTLPFELNIDKWETMDKEVRSIVSRGWKNIKFLNAEGNALNEAISAVPDNVGGIYVFVLRPELIPNLHLYIMYIGRARRCKGFSLRKRCKSYMRDTRPLIAMMRDLWGKALYFYYLPIEDDILIEKVERELNRVIKAPCNSQYPDEYVTVMPNQKAF